MDNQIIFICHNEEFQIMADLAHKLQYINTLGCPEQCKSPFTATGGCPTTTAGAIDNSDLPDDLTPGNRVIYGIPR